MTAGSDISNGAASSLTDRSGAAGKPHHQSPARRVGKRRESAVEWIG